MQNDTTQDVMAKLHIVEMILKKIKPLFYDQKISYTCNKCGLMKTTQVATFIRYFHNW
jgi:hypothetical protein